MRKITVLLGILMVLLAVILSSTSVDAITITFDVPFVLIGPVLTGISAHVDLSSSGLNGVIFQGQTLSLDFVLAEDVLARVFRSGLTEFFVQISTNAPGSPGTPANLPTGFLIGRNGAPAGTTAMGTWSQHFIPDGLVFIFLNDAASACCSGAIDISGVHLDVMLPNTGFAITDAHLFLQTFQLQFGTASQLPEPATLVLVLIGIVFVAIVLRSATARPAHGRHGV